MFGSLGLTELLVIFGIGAILFGAKRLPTLGRSLGEGIQSFRGALRELHSSDDGERDD